MEPLEVALAGVEPLERPLQAQLQRFDSRAASRTRRGSALASTNDGGDDNDDVWDDGTVEQLPQDGTVDWTPAELSEDDGDDLSGDSPLNVELVEDDGPTTRVDADGNVIPVGSGDGDGDGDGDDYGVVDDAGDAAAGSGPVDEYGISIVETSDEEADNADFEAIKAFVQEQKAAHREALAAAAAAASADSGGALDSDGGTESGRVSFADKSLTGRLDSAGSMGQFTDDEEDPTRMSPSRLRKSFNDLRKLYHAERSLRVGHLKDMRETFASDLIRRFSVRLIGMVRRARHRLRRKAPRFHPTVQWAKMTTSDRVRELLVAVCHRRVREGADRVRHGLCGPAGFAAAVLCLCVCACVRVCVCACVCVDACVDACLYVYACVYVYVYVYALLMCVAWRGMAWHGVAWRGVAWLRMAWRGVAWDVGMIVAYVCVW